MVTQPTEQTSVVAQPTAPDKGAQLPPLSDTPIDSLEETYSVEEMIAAETAKLGSVETPTPTPAAEVPAPEVPEPAPAAAETPEPKAEEAKPEEKERILPSKIPTRQFSEIEQEAIALGKSLKEAGEEVPPLKERIEIVERQRTAQAQAEATPPPVIAPPEPSVVEQLTTELVELDAKLKEAGEKESAFTPELAEIVAKRGSIAADLAVAKAQQAVAEQAAQAGFANQRATATAEAARLFPAVNEATSELKQRVNREIAAMKNPAHPSHDTLFAADSPLLITQKVAFALAQEKATANGTSVAEELAILMPGKSAAKVNAPAATPEPQTKKVTPASGNAAIAPTPAAPSGVDLLKQPYDPNAFDKWMDDAYGPTGPVMGMR